MDQGSPPLRRKAPQAPGDRAVVGEALIPSSREHGPHLSSALQEICISYLDCCQRERSRHSRHKILRCQLGTWWAAGLWGPPSWWLPNFSPSPLSPHPLQGELSVCLFLPQMSGRG